MKKKMLLSACAASLLALTLAGCTQSTAQQADYIGADAAKAIALEAAGIGEADAAFTSAELESRNNTAYYEVDFTAGGQEYDYDIDALTGTVIQHSQKAADDGSAAANPGGAAAANAAVSEDRAREIALEHAGLTADQVTFIRSHLDYDDGRQCYDVEFYTADYKEYDYEIDANTGDVISYDYDAEGYQGQGQSSGTSAITADRAKEIALAEVPGASASDIYEFETDRDDGRLEYEGTIYYNGTEYEFTIDGYSGAIRDWDVEHHHR